MGRCRSQDARGTIQGHAVACLLVVVAARRLNASHLEPPGGSLDSWEEGTGSDLDWGSKRGGYAGRMSTAASMFRAIHAPRRMPQARLRVGHCSQREACLLAHVGLENTETTSCRTGPRNVEHSDEECVPSV